MNAFHDILSDHGTGNLHLPWREDLRLESCIVYRSRSISASQLQRVIKVLLHFREDLSASIEAFPNITENIYYPQRHAIPIPISTLAKNNNSKNRESPFQKQGKIYSVIITSIARARTWNPWFVGARSRIGLQIYSNQQHIRMNSDVHFSSLHS